MGANTEEETLLAAAHVRKEISEMPREVKYFAPLVPHVCGALQLKETDCL